MGNISRSHFLYISIQSECLTEQTGKLNCTTNALAHIGFYQSRIFSFFGYDDNVRIVKSPSISKLFTIFFVFLYFPASSFIVACSRKKPTTAQYVRKILGCEDCSRFIGINTSVRVHEYRTIFNSRIVLIPRVKRNVKIMTIFTFFFFTY